MPRERKVPTNAPAAGSNFPVLKDKKAIAAAEEYYGLVQDESRIEGRKKELKPLLLAAMGDAPTAFAGARVLTASAVNAKPPTPPRVITKEMLGQTIPGSKGKAGYTQLSVS